VEDAKENALRSLADSIVLEVLTSDDLKLKNL